VIFHSVTKSPTSRLDPPPTRTRRHPRLSHASRLLNRRVKRSSSTSTSHTATATLAGPTRKLSPHARLATRSSLSTPRTPMSHSATTRTLPTSSTSVQTQSSPSPSSTRLKNHCQSPPLAWSLHLLPPAQPGQKISITKIEPKNTENRTEKYRTEENRFLFGSQISSTERTEVNLVSSLG
jgi:hypothetical protein